MQITLVTYKVKKEFTEQNIVYIKKVFDDLIISNSDNTQYAAFLAEDGQTFTHIVGFTDTKPDMVNHESFKQFQAQLKDIIISPPKATPLTIIGDYQIFNNK